MIMRNRSSVTIYESHCQIHPGDEEQVLNSSSPYLTIHVCSDIGDCTIIKQNGSFTIKSYGKLSARIKNEKKGLKIIEFYENW